MLSKINPGEIIWAHVSTFSEKRGGKVEYFPVVFQLALALFLAGLHLKFFAVSENVVSIVVSVASIIAGLLLNLMVLVYTLITGRLRISKSNAETVGKLGNETIANIAFCILCSIFLIVAALLNLTDIKHIQMAGQFLMCFFGVLVALTVMMILVNFYTIIKNSAK